MKKNRAQKDILRISISIFVLTAIWIGFNIFHAYATSTIEPDLQLQIEAIEPQFNTSSIAKLKSRKIVIPQYQIDDASSSANTSLDASPESTSSAIQQPQSASPTGPFLRPGL